MEKSAGPEVPRRVWGIGLTRTGTTSLAAALNQLGYRTVHWPTTAQLLWGAVPSATDESVAAVYKYLDFVHPGSKFILSERDEESWIRSVRKHRAKQHAFFSNAKQLSDAFNYTGPGPSVFDTFEYGGHNDVFRQLLHTALRVKDGRPGLAHIQRERDRLVEWAFTQTSLYGTFAFDEDRFREGYRRHHADVSAYFRDRPDDFLRLRISDGEGWEKLCPFLGIPMLDIPFPRVNTALQHQGSAAR
jgi:hypothetical protein